MPRWLENGRSGPPRSSKDPPSSITRHVLQCDSVSRDSLRSRFAIASTARTGFLLTIVEALEIAQKRPALCQQKDLAFTLRLPWT